MNGCRRIEPWIVRSVDGDLKPDEALRLARHVAECTSCRIVLARESRLAALLDGVQDECGVDESFFGAVMAALPDRPLPSAVKASQRERRRRGLRLAALGSIVAVAAGLAARMLPSVRFDVATPAMPRFVQDDPSGWVSWIGSATQWIQMTAQSIAWVGSSGARNPWTMGTLSLLTALIGAVTLLAVSGALAWASRARSRAS